MLVNITEEDKIHLSMVRESLISLPGTEGIVKTIERIIDYKPKTLEDLGYKKIEERKQPYHLLYENEENNSIHFYENKADTLFSVKKEELIAIINKMDELAAVHEKGVHHGF